MSVEENILLMRRWFQEVWDEERTKTIYDLLAENAIGVGQDQPGNRNSRTGWFRCPFQSHPWSLSRCESNR